MELRRKLIRKHNINILRSIAILASFVFVSMVSSNSFAALKKIGVVGAVNQSLSATDANSKDRKLALGNDVFFNDTLKTDASGKAQLMFIDKSALTVGPNSSVKIDKFVYNPADSTGELTMRGTKGAFRFIGGALSKKKPVEFKTPVGTIGIRGGIAIVEINPTNGATNATFLYGEKMTFQNLKGQISETTNAGFAISLASATAAPSVPVAVNSATLAVKVQQNFISTGNQTGGLNKVPTGKDLDKVGGSINVEDESAGGPNGGPNNGGDRNNNNGEGDKGKDNGQNRPQGNNSTQNNGGQANNGKDSNGKPMAAGENRNGNDGGNNNQGGNQGYAGGPNGKNSANGNGGPMPRDPGILTSDGGYMDENGKHHSASELAAYRREQAASTTNNSGGYVATAPGTAPAVKPIAGSTGTYAAGSYYGAPSTTTGYVAPAAPGTYTNTTQPYYSAQSQPYYSADSTTIYSATNTATGTVKYTTDQINAGALAAYNAAYARAIGLNLTVAQATAAATYADGYFRNTINNGTEFQAATTAAEVATSTYLSSLTGTTVTSTGTVNTTSTIDLNALQTAENVRAISTNLGSKYTIYNETLPTLTSGVTVANTPNPVDGKLVEQTFAQRDALRQVMCTTCQYVHWDAWGKINPTAPASGNIPDVRAKMVPYIYGTVTPLANIAGQNWSATYTGNASYNYHGSPNLTYGGFTSTINNASGSLSVTSMNFQNVPGASNLYTSGSHSFTNGTTFTSLPLTNGSSFTGTASGALFGPNAENIGGNMTYTNGSSSGGGVYLGKK